MITQCWCKKLCDGINKRQKQRGKGRITLDNIRYFYSEAFIHRNSCVSAPLELYYYTFRMDDSELRFPHSEHKHQRRFTAIPGNRNVLLWATFLNFGRGAVGAIGALSSEKKVHNVRWQRFVNIMHCVKKVDRSFSPSLINARTWNLPMELKGRRFMTDRSFQMSEVGWTCEFREACLEKAGGHFPIT